MRTWILSWHQMRTLYCYAAETLVEVTALGPEEVPFEKLAAREFATPLRLAGTYVVQASLDGMLLPGEPHTHAMLRTASLSVCSAFT